MPEPTYRPYLTSSEVTNLLNALKSFPASLTVKDATALIRKLELFQAKINLGHTAPAYQPAPTMAEKLEISDAPAPRTITEIRLEAYRKFTQNPTSCSSKEIEHAQAFRYENDLMSRDEEIEYEQMRG